MTSGKVVTRLEVQKRNKNRVNVHIDGEYAFSCSSELVYTHGIKVNRTVELDKLREIVSEDNFLKCKNDAMKIIERSYKSEKQVFDKLVLKGYDEKTIARVMEFLKSYSFINDELYAKMYIRDKIKYQGSAKIKYSLVKKGIAKEAVEEQLKEVDSSSELNTAVMLCEKKYKALLKTEKDKRKISSKLWEYLARSGYSGETVKDALNKVVSAEEEEICEEEIEVNYEELKELALKRYNLLSKNEDDKRKLYKKLGDYLLRRGYAWDNVKLVLKDVLNGEVFE